MNACMHAGPAAVVCAAVLGQAGKGRRRRDAEAGLGAGLACLQVPSAGRACTYGA